MRASVRRCIYEYRFGQAPLTQAFRATLHTPPNAYTKTATATDAVTTTAAATALAHATTTTTSPATTTTTTYDDGVLCTTLSNGVRVVTHERGSATAHVTIGLYADAGPKYDPAALPGLSYVLRYALQTSNMEHSLFQLDRAMRAGGAAYGHGEVDKRYLYWKLQARVDAWERPFEVYATGLAAPRLCETDIERFRDTMDNALQELRWQRPRVYVVDALETVAFYKEPLGSPRMVPAITNDRCNHDALLEQWATLVQPSRVTVAGVNVPHDALVAAYERLPYRHTASAPHHARAAAAATADTTTTMADGRRHHSSMLPRCVSHADERAQFYAGRQCVEYEARANAMGTLPDMDREVIAAVGVTTYGRDEGVARYATALVVRELCESRLAAAMTSTPGAGAPSPYDAHDGAGVRVFYRPYASAGLIGYTLRAAPEHVHAMLQHAMRAWPATLADYDNNDNNDNSSSSSDGALRVARQRAQLRLLHDAHDTASDYCDHLATSPHSLAATLDAIARVGAAEVNEALQHILSQQPATYATGDTFVFPMPARLNKL